jgi:hypothetical protein
LRGVQTIDNSGDHLSCTAIEDTNRLGRFFIRTDPAIQGSIRSE